MDVSPLSLRHTNATVTVEIVGYVWRDGVKGPAKYLCLTYQRDPKKRLVAPAVRRRISKPRYRCHMGRCLQDVQVSVFVDVVEGVDPAETLSDLRVSRWRLARLHLTWPPDHFRLTLVQPVKKR